MADVPTDVEQDRYRNAALLCAASYEADPVNFINQEARHKGRTHSIGEVVKTENFGDGLSYILARSVDKKTSFISIGGSEAWKNWCSNLNVAGARIEGMDGRVHCGFRDHAQKLPLPYLIAHAATCKDVVFTGHSLGGATAALGALLLRRKVNPSIASNCIKCITFGSPLFGDAGVRTALYDSSRLPPDERRKTERSFMNFIKKEDVVPTAMICLKRFRGISEFILGKLLGILHIGQNDGNGKMRTLLECVDRFSEGAIPRYVPIGKFEFLDYNGNPHDHIFDALNEDGPSLTKEGIENHGISKYLEGVYGKHWGGERRIISRRKASGHGERSESHSGVQPVRRMQLTVNIVKECCKAGILSAGNGSRHVRLEMFGDNVGLLLPLEKESATLDGYAIESVQLLRQDAMHVLYDIHVKQGLQHGVDGLNLTVPPRCRFGRTEVVRLPLRSSWFQNRKETIKNGSIVESMAHLRSYIVAQVAHREMEGEDRDDATTLEVAPFRDSIRKLDEWLDEAISEFGKDKRWRHDLLLKVIHLVTTSSPTPTSTGTNNISACVPDILSVMTSKNKKEGKEKFGELEVKLGEEWSDECEVPPELLQNVFQSIALDNISRDANVVEPWMTRRAEVLTSLALGVVFPKVVESARKKSRNLFLTSAVTFSVVVLGATLVAISDGLVIPVFAAGMAAFGGGAVALPIVLIRALSRDSGYTISQFAELAMLEKLETIPEGQCGSLFSRERSVLSWIQDSKEWTSRVNDKKLRKKITVKNRTPLISFLAKFLGPASELREELLAQSTFTVGIVGQPGAGKSTLAKSLFPDIVRYAPCTDRPKLYSCSKNIALKDYPGMLGTDESVYADIEMLRNTAPTLDAVVVLLKATDLRSFDIRDILKLVQDKNIYICLTCCDVFNNAILYTACTEEECQSTLDQLEQSKETFRRQNHLDDSFVHFFCPSEDRYGRYPALMDEWCQSNLHRPRDLSQWLIDEAVGCGVSRDEAETTFKPQPRNWDVEAGGFSTFRRWFRLHV